MHNRVKRGVTEKNGNLWSKCGRRQKVMLSPFQKDGGKSSYKRGSLLQNVALFEEILYNK